ncbi:MAG: 30S ribosomal protein S20 [Planctomycetota bacterium]
MAHSLSAKKRIRQNVKRRALNRWRNRGYREAIKEYDELILHGSVEQCEEKLSALYKQLDQTAATPAMHKNTASRYKARLSARLNRKRVASSA